MFVSAEIGSKIINAIISTENKWLVSSINKNIYYILNRGRSRNLERGDAKIVCKACDYNTYPEFFFFFFFFFFFCG